MSLPAVSRFVPARALTPSRGVPSLRVLLPPPPLLTSLLLAVSSVLPPLAVGAVVAKLLQSGFEMKNMLSLKV